MGGVNNNWHKREYMWARHTWVLKKKKFSQV